MMQSISKEVWERARQIFERDKPKDVEFGAPTMNGRQAFGFDERTNPNSPTKIYLDEDARAVYIKRAQEELESEKGS